MTVKGKLPAASVGGMVTVTVASVPKLLGVMNPGLNVHSAPGGRLPQVRLTT